MLPGFADYRRIKDEVLERTAHRQASIPQGKGQDKSYVSLTETARAHSGDTPGYVIQSWLRSRNTLAFLEPIRK